MYVKSFGRYKIIWVYGLCDSLIFEKETKELRYTNRRKQLFKKSDTHQI